MSSSTLDGGRTSTILNPDVIFTQDAYYWLNRKSLAARRTYYRPRRINVLSYGTTPSIPERPDPPQIPYGRQNGTTSVGRMLTHGRIHIAAHVDSDSGLQILRLLLNEKEEEKYLTEPRTKSTTRPISIRITRWKCFGLSPGRYKLSRRAGIGFPLTHAELVFDVNAHNRQLPTGDPESDST